MVFYLPSDSGEKVGDYLLYKKKYEEEKNW